MLHLAESWDTDGKTYTFKLRTDVKFRSGNPFTAEDVVFSLDRMKALGQGLSYLFANVEKAEAVDAATVKFTLTSPYSPFASALLSPHRRQEARHGKSRRRRWRDEGLGPTYLSAHGASSGAYKVVSHNPQEETVMARNADYFLGVPAKAPDTMRLRYGLEPATMRTLVSQGEHDITSQWLPPEVLKALTAGGAQLLTESGGGGFYVKMNTTKKPLDDLNCRLALTYAFDYLSGIKMVAITDTVSQGSPASGALPVGMPGSLPASDAYARDLD